MHLIKIIFKIFKNFKGKSPQTRDKVIGTSVS